ncbi:hypothetical protein RN001_009623 [Aquatica leii]|uniref:Uncharacterized protein n=1 Tax=Aquatica leii TaxID=1421715 RepID=A0AAN7PVK0_9COLE|nr:hypothetical protein RN001_009623 [Aquatica leii]
MGPPKLYMVDVSPEVRAVLLTAKAIGITIDLKIIPYSNPDEFASVFLKQIPQHSSPFLIDNGYVIWNSQAIIAFLIGKYANDDSLYPREHIQRTIIDQRLHFSTDVIFANLSCIVRRMIKRGISHTPTDMAYTLREAYDFLEEFLENQKWVAGEHLTIADLCLIPTVTSADILVPIDPVKYPNIWSWIKSCQDLPYYKEGNQIGLDNFKRLIKTLRC